MENLLYVGTRDILRYIRDLSIKAEEGDEMSRCILFALSYMDDRGYGITDEGACAPSDRVVQEAVTLFINGVYNVPKEITIYPMETHDRVKIGSNESLLLFRSRDEEEREIERQGEGDQYLYYFTHYKPIRVCLREDWGIEKVEGIRLFSLDKLDDDYFDYIYYIQTICMSKSLTISPVPAHL